MKDWRLQIFRAFFMIHVKQESTDIVRNNRNGPEAGPKPNSTCSCIFVWNAWLVSKRCSSNAVILRIESELWTNSQLIERNQCRSIEVLPRHTNNISNIGSHLSRCIVQAILSPVIRIDHESLSEMHIAYSTDRDCNCRCRRT